eukprot:3911441-Amphidinium_carterae.1
MKNGTGNSEKKHAKTFKYSGEQQEPVAIKNSMDGFLKPVLLFVSLLFSSIDMQKWHQGKVTKQFEQSIGTGHPSMRFRRQD